MRILLSYNAVDAFLAEALRATLFVVAPDVTFVFSPMRCPASVGHERRAADPRKFDALLLLCGPSGLSNEQETEWAAATRYAARNKEFVVVSVLVGDCKPPKQTALPEHRWFKAPVVTEREMARKLISLLHGQYSRSLRE